MMVNGESFNMLNQPEYSQNPCSNCFQTLTRKLIYLENEITYLRSIAL